MDNPIDDTAVTSEPTFPGYLFGQFAAKRSRSDQGIALLSILDNECVSSNLSKINESHDGISEYLSELHSSESELVAEILNGAAELSVDILNVRWEPLIYTVIPFSEANNKIIGTLADECPDNRSINGHSLESGEVTKAPQLSGAFLLGQITWIDIERGQLQRLLRRILHEGSGVGSAWAGAVGLISDYGYHITPVTPITLAFGFLANATSRASL